MITLKELAKELKVSVSTVSKALHDSPEISVQTIEKVKNLAKKPAKGGIPASENKNTSIDIALDLEVKRNPHRSEIFNNSPSALRRFKITAKIPNVVTK